MNLGDLAPPILRKLFSRYRLSRVYTDYAEALADTHTYEDPQLIDLVSAKTLACRDSLASEPMHLVRSWHTLQTLFVLARIGIEGPLRVLEVGGACGALYFEMSHFLAEKIQAWHVVETPSMAKAARRLFQDDRLRFFDSLQEGIAGYEPDLIIASFVLPYLPNPIEFFGFLLDVGARYVYVCRTPVGVGIRVPLITKQTCDLSSHGPGKAPKHFQDRKTSQPITIIPEQTLLNAIPQHYKLLVFFQETETERIFIGLKTIRQRFVAFLVERIIECKTDA